MATNSNINMRGQLSSGDLTTGIRSPGWFAKWPAIGITILLLGILAFGARHAGRLAQSGLLQ